jgi:hypothetical protein
MTALARSNRYLAVGIWKVYWIPTVADYTAITRSEITAGTEISGEIASLTGFTTTANSLPTPDGASLFTSSVPGMTTADDSSINFWGDEDGADARTLFTLRGRGVVLFMDGGDDETKKMEAFPVAVSKRDIVRSLTDPLQVAIGFTVTAEPREQDIPAAA